MSPDARFGAPSSPRGTATARMLGTALLLALTSGALLALIATARGTFAGLPSLF
jgi:hypothetical protein